jgi:ketosteroid isomerase-like protein
MKRLLKVVALLLMVDGALVPTAVGQSAPQEAAIRKVLQSQVEAWNRHDLEGFMAGYWNSPDLTFFSGATETQGWQATLERYRKKYQSADTEMGKLEFRDLQVKMLGPKAGFVRGKFLLTLSNGKQPHGLFTLIFREFPEGWRIVHDHSSGE